jgi:hypothetical protein
MAPSGAQSSDAWTFWDETFPARVFIADIKSILLHVVQVPITFPNALYAIVVSVVDKRDRFCNNVQGFVLVLKRRDLRCG